MQNPSKSPQPRGHITKSAAELRVALWAATWVTGATNRETCSNCYVQDSRLTQMPLCAFCRLNWE